jgi:hypothetical protein
MGAFTARYFEEQHASTVNAAALAYWDLCAVLRLSRLAGADLDGWAAFFLPYGRADITAAAIREQVADFTASALARLTGSEIL